ncbi:hypothetical protein VTJ04DRAFT_1021 [Mycothermus thermophilus]|uniref:uncharacterized protein n=1 Tax=Humicola insolens TaxID=85995 RepID=UPI003742F374
MSTEGFNPTYYQILSLSPSTLSSSSSSEPEEQLIRRAYRRALLAHHPDKAKPNHPLSNIGGTTQGNETPLYTIDQITTAYATLSRPSLRQAYDLALLQHQQQTSSFQGIGRENFQTGIEIVDLDDLQTTTITVGSGEEETRWYRACRCGNPRGYEFGEADLEEAADVGELMVGCADCSLWLRVQFAVIEEEEEDMEMEDVNTEDNGTERREDCEV